MARVLLTFYANLPNEKIGELVSEFGAICALEQLQNCDLDNELTTKLQTNDLAKDFAEILCKTEKVNSQILTPSSPFWPAKLMDLDFETPLCLWTLGNLENLNNDHQQIAVVGSRAATNYGERIAFEIGSTLAKCGIPVISGAAYGIDAAAHRGTLDAGGSTLAILASGIDIAYPRAHGMLLKKIRENGIVATEAPPGMPPLKQKFLTRNRIIAALSNQVVVVEAAYRSGSLSTANWANALGRKVWGVPGSILSNTSAGIHLGIRNQNMEILIKTEDLLLNHDC